MTEMKKHNFNRGFSAVIILLIASVVILGIVGYVITRSSSSSTPNKATERANDAKTKLTVPAGEATSTFPGIIGQGKNLECDWKMPTEASGSNPFGAGKLYTTANKGRSEISGNSGGMSIDGNAIYKDGAAYSWITVAGTTIGFKFDQAELENMNSEMTPEQKQQAEQIRAKMIFSCKPWTPDESKFTLPSGVEFK